MTIFKEEFSRKNKYVKTCVVNNGKFLNNPKLCNVKSINIYVAVGHGFNNYLKEVDIKQFI